MRLSSGSGAAHSSHDTSLLSTFHIFVFCFRAESGKIRSLWRIDARHPICSIHSRYVAYRSLLEIVRRVDQWPFQDRLVYRTAFLFANRIAKR